MASAVINPLASLVGYQLRRASAAAMEELTQELASIGLKPTEASILVLIQANPMVKPSEVGRELGIQRANMTPLVGSLERRGFLAREAVDGRSQGLSLTPAGQTSCENALTVMHSHDARLRERLQANQKGQVAMVLSRL